MLTYVYKLVHPSPIRSRMWVHILHIAAPGGIQFPAQGAPGLGHTGNNPACRMASRLAWEPQKFSWPEALPLRGCRAAWANNHLLSIYAPPSFPGIQRSLVATRHTFRFGTGQTSLAPRGQGALYMLYLSLVSLLLDPSYLQFILLFILKFWWDGRLRTLSTGSRCMEPACIHG